MAWRKLVLAFGAGVFLLAAPATGSDDQEKQKLVIEIIRLTKLDAVSRQTHERLFDLIAEQIRAKHPKVSEKALNVVREVLREEFDGMVDELIPFTARMMMQQFTLEDLEVMLRFYESPTGQKAMAALPSITQQSFAFSQRWTREAMPRIQQALRERLSKEGIDI